MLADELFAVLAIPACLHAPAQSCRSAGQLAAGLWFFLCLSACRSPGPALSPRPLWGGQQLIGFTNTGVILEVKLRQEEQGIEIKESKEAQVAGGSYFTESKHLFFSWTSQLSQRTGFGQQPQDFAFLSTLRTAGHGVRTIHDEVWNDLGQCDRNRTLFDQSP